MTNPNQTIAPKRQKLTKQFFMSVAPYCFIVSNVMNSLRRPVYAEYVATANDRKHQWEAIVSARVAQRTCMVFINKQYLNFCERHLGSGPMGQPAAN